MVKLRYVQRMKKKSISIYSLQKGISDHIYPYISKYKYLIIR